MSGQTNSESGSTTLVPSDDEESWDNRDEAEDDSNRRDIQDGIQVVEGLV